MPDKSSQRPRPKSPIKQNHAIHQLYIILTARSNNNSSLSINTICRCISYTDIYHKNEFAQFEINQPSHACCYKKRLKVQESLLADICQVTCAYMQQRCKAQYFLIDGGADQYVLILKGPNFFSAALTITVQFRVAIYNALCKPCLLYILLVSPGHQSEHSCLRMAHYVYFAIMVRSSKLQTFTKTQI